MKIIYHMTATRDGKVVSSEEYDVTPDRVGGAFKGLFDGGVLEYWTTIEELRPFPTLLKFNIKCLDGRGSMKMAGVLPAKVIALAEGGTKEVSGITAPPLISEVKLSINQISELATVASFEFSISVTPPDSPFGAEVPLSSRRSLPGLRRR